MVLSALVRICTLCRRLIPNSKSGVIHTAFNRKLTIRSVGNYNYQKANINGSTYEIECYEQFPVGLITPTGSIYTMEQCLGLCSAQNNIGASTIGCVGISYNALSDQCYVYTSTAYPNGMPQGSQSTTFNFRSARLLYSTYPLINDQVYLLPNVSSGNLGICSGNGANAYAQSHMNTQYLNGQYQGSLTNNFWIECGGNFWAPPDAGSNANVTQLIAAINSDPTLNPTGPGLPIGMPQSADDCQRLCFISYASVSALFGGSSKYGQPGGYGLHQTATSNQCLSWTWSVSNQCDLYIRSNSVNSFTYNATVVAAGHWIGSGGTAQVGTDTAVGYKKRAVESAVPDASLSGRKY